MSRPKVLLVDDNVELLQLLARLFEADGWTPVTASKGRQAVDLVGLERPQVAVVDVLLPDMMGFDVAAALRQAKVPFVFMTGVFKGGRAASEARAQHGAAAYFEKPFEARKLLETLRALVPSATAPRAAPRPHPPAETHDFDVEVAVEGDEPLESMELTGRVVVTEGGKVAALQGENITAAPVAAPARPAPSPQRQAPPRPTPEARPHRPAPDLAQTEGDLRERFPDLVTAFHLAQQTGELTVLKGKVKKTVYFERGRPCFAISNLVADRFGPFLVRVAKITPTQLELVKAAADSTGRRTGDVLVEMGLLKEGERLYFVAQQVKAIIYSIFGWQEGQYRLHFTDRAAREAVKLDLNPANLIVRGVKKLYKPERLRALLSPEERLIPSQDPPYDLHEVQLDRWEAELLPQVDGTRTVAELIALSRRPEHMVYAFLYAMVALKLLERR
ncbi:MAG TPA: response regulator [Anaeromyxobacteraceae bacterium]|nr:response regulator [Anaeromyxobacteraceae bacterium]